MAENINEAAENHAKNVWKDFQFLNNLSGHHGQSKKDFISGAEWQSQQKEVADLKAELKVTDELLNDRQRLLDAIPECPKHGKCVPYALEWIEKMKLSQKNYNAPIVRAYPPYLILAQSEHDYRNKVNKINSGDTDGFMLLPDLYVEPQSQQKETKPTGYKNAAFVLSQFVWNNELPKRVFEGSIEKGFELNQQILLEYLMKFQRWLLDESGETEETKPVEEDCPHPYNDVCFGENGLECKCCGKILDTMERYLQPQTKPADDNKCPYEKAVCEYYGLNHSAIKETDVIKDDFGGLVNLVYFVTQKISPTKPVEDKP